MGIKPTDANQKQSSVNWKFTIFLSFLLHQWFTAIAFLVFEAESMFDYGLAFYIFLSITNSTVISLLFLFEKENTFEFIKNCERFIEKREYIIYVFVRIKLKLFEKFKN